MAGVEGQATMFLNLVRGDWLSRFPPGSEILFIAGLGMLFGFGLVRFRSIAAIALAVAALVVVAAASYAAFRQHLWFPWLIVAVQVVVALTWSILYNSFQYYAQKRLMEHTLSLYLSPKLVGKFARDPKLLKPGTKIPALAANIDIAPTFLALAGAPIPSTMQGKSLVPVLKNPKAKVRTELFCEYFQEAQFPKTPTWRALRTERYKYVHYPELQGADEFYDLQKDPGELKNIVAHPKAKPFHARLVKPGVPTS